MTETETLWCFQVLLR